jgi:hypothetical protein
MPEVKYRDNKSEATRIADRLKPSNEMQTAGTHVQMGEGPTRVHHTVHRSATNLRHDNPKSRSILRSDADTDNVRPTAGPPITGHQK